MKLGVNVDHVATVRQARGGKTPDPVEAARICERAGAHSIVMHLREDRRHIADHDVRRARRKLRTRFNLEMALHPEIVRIALSVCPDQVTLVPEKRLERTTESGLDVCGDFSKIARAIESFHKKKIVVSLFVDPLERQLVASKALGADAVELHTGDYADARNLANRRRQLAKIALAVSIGRQLGLVTHAGHGLDYENIAPFRKFDGIEELNIGYSIVSRALWVGLDRAVREMIALVQ